MKRTLFILFALFLCLALFSSAKGRAESVTCMNLTSDLRNEVIIEKTSLLGEGLSETSVNIYKYTPANDLKLVWKGVKRMGFLSTLNRLPPYENGAELPFCIVSDISMADTDGDGVMEIETATKKVYYDKETRSEVISEEPVHARIFYWDKKDQRYE
jgi:hypothetical protein